MELPRQEFYCLKETLGLDKEDSSFEYAGIIYQIPRQIPQ